MKKLKIILLTYLILFLFSIFAYIFRPEVYVRPIYFFLGLSSLVTVNFIQVSLVRFTRKIELLCFLQIVAIPLLFVISQYDLYNTVLGRDPWVHWSLTDVISWSGHIPSFADFPNPYVDLPGFHLIVSSVEQVTSLNYKWASLIGVGFTTLFLLLIVCYLIAKTLFKNRKIALLSCLFLAISDNVLDMVGKSIIPNSIGIAIAFLILFFMMKSDFYGDLKLKLICIILIVGLAFIHTVSYMFMIIQSIILIISDVLFLKRRNINNGIRFFLVILLVSFLVWGFHSVYFNSLLRIFEVFFAEGAEIGYVSSLPLSIYEWLLSRLGMAIFFALVGFYSLKVLITELNRKNTQKFTFSILVISFVIGSGSFIFPALKGISHRFWYYAEVLGSMFFAKLVYKPRMKSIIIGSVAVLFLSFLMFTASISNDDNPLVPQYTIRTGWLDSELSAGTFIVNHYANLPLGSDWDYFLALNNLYVKLVKLEKLSLIQNPITTFDDIAKEEGIFIIRNEILRNRYFELGVRWNNLPYAPLGEDLPKITAPLVNTSSLIYDSKSTLIILN